MNLTVIFIANFTEITPMRSLIRIIITITTLLCTSTYNCCAQNKKWTSKEAMSKVGEFFYSSTDSASFFLHYLIDLKEQDTLIAKHYNNLGLLYSRNQKDSAIFYYTKSIQLGTSKNRLSTMLNLANIYKNNRNFSQSLALLEKVVAGYEELGNQKGIGSAYGVMGSV